MLLRLAAHPQVRRYAEPRAADRELVRRFVPGPGDAAVADAAGELQVRGRRIALLHLGGEPRDPAGAHAHRERLRRMLRSLDQAGLTGEGQVEVCLRLSGLGACLPGSGARASREHARAVAESAAGAGGRVIVLTEDGVPGSHVLATVDVLRAEFPGTGVGLRACSREAEAQLAERIASGCRVRLSKGWAPAAGPAAHGRHGTDLAFVRCLTALLRSQVPFSVSAADRRIMEIADTLVERGIRARGSFEYHLRFNDRPLTEANIADRGDIMRVLVPFGEDWYRYVIERAAGQPALLARLLRRAAPR